MLVACFPRRRGAPAAPGDPERRRTLVSSLPKRRSLEGCRIEAVAGSGQSDTIRRSHTRATDLHRRSGLPRHRLTPTIRAAGPTSAESGDYRNPLRSPVAVCSRSRASGLGARPERLPRAQVPQTPPPTAPGHPERPIGISASHKLRSCRLRRRQIRAWPTKSGRVVLPPSAIEMPLRVDPRRRQSTSWRHLRRVAAFADL